MNLTTASKQLPIEIKELSGIVNAYFTKQDSGYFFTVKITQIKGEDATYNVKFFKFWQDQKENDSFITAYQGTQCSENNINGYIVSGIIKVSENVNTVQINRITMITSHEQNETVEFNYFK